ncbi:MAG: DUF4234 domain-containing protein [Bacteroidetes bacterium]|uniref:DUF4234 domain-containing protein n=1 Tax=Candidatus Cryptobacteroides merdavium TaxID=2840769 RepID=A0A9D9EBT3_9BACT|nr:DUF4234 domain-containing protein [Candidatus Cryptobacteroides merdavium]
MLTTDRGLLKFILLSIITFGIYAIVVMTKVSIEINMIATKHDGKNTMNYCLIFFIFSWLTLGIAPLVWYHRLCARIGDELKTRSIPYDFSVWDFWGWEVFGSLIVVGPFIFCHRFFKAMNFLCESYNAELAAAGPRF